MALERNKGPLRDEEMLRLFREIMSACLAQQEPLKVGVPRPRGHVHAGGGAQALRPLGARAAAAVDRRGLPRSGGGHRRLRRRADRELDRGHGQQHAGPVPDLAAQDLRRGRAAHPPVPDGAHGVARARSQRICSHPQSLAQCRGWLDEHLPDVERDPGVEQRRGRAARARRDRARRRSPARRRRRSTASRSSPREIEDRPDNTTRFLVIGRKLLRAERAATARRCSSSVPPHRRAGRAVPPARAVRAATASA